MATLNTVGIAELEAGEEMERQGVGAGAARFCRWIENGLAVTSSAPVGYMHIGPWAVCGTTAIYNVGGTPEEVIHTKCERLDADNNVSCFESCEVLLFPTNTLLGPTRETPPPPVVSWSDWQLAFDSGTFGGLVWMATRSND